MLLWFRFLPLITVCVKIISFVSLQMAHLDHRECVGVCDDDGGGIRANLQKLWIAANRRQLTVSLLPLPVQGHARAMAPAGDVGGGGGGPAKTAGSGRRAGEEAGRPDPQVGRRHHVSPEIPLRYHSLHLRGLDVPKPSDFNQVPSFPPSRRVYFPHT